MHPIYVAHGYRDRESKYFNYFGSLMRKSGFVPSIDPPSNDVNAAKLERHLNFTDGLIAILTYRPEGISQHILFEISMAIRSNKPVLVYAEDDISQSVIPRGVMVKRFSSQSYIRQTPDHMHMLKNFRSFIGESLIARYRICEKQKSCILIGADSFSTDLRNSIYEVLESKGYSVDVLNLKNRVLPLRGELHRQFRESDLAICVVNVKSPLNNYVLGAVQASLTPTITLATKNYPTVSGIPIEYQRRIITNSNIESDVAVVRKQVELFEEDPLDLYSEDELENYTNCLSNIDTPGHYSNETRT